MRRRTVHTDSPPLKTAAMRVVENYWESIFDARKPPEKQVRVPNPPFSSHPDGEIFMCVPINWTHSLTLKNTHTIKSILSLIISLVEAMWSTNSYPVWNEYIWWKFRTNEIQHQALTPGSSDLAHQSFQVRHQVTISILCQHWHLVVVLNKQLSCVWTKCDPETLRPSGSSLEFLNSHCLQFVQQRFARSVQPCTRC